MTVKACFPTYQALEEAPVASVAGAILKTIHPRSGNGEKSFHVKNMISEVQNEYGRWESGRAASQALGWLMARGFTCQSPNSDFGWFILTKDGLEAAQVQEFAAWVADRDLPESLLHSAIAAESLASFKVGKFDTAVFEAFRALEVRIRESAKLGHDLIGTRLAARAFNPEDGPLTDKNAEAGERTALMNLMTGALGYFKNPQSHRKVDLEAFEAREMLVFASYLYRIAEARKLSS